MALHRSDSGSQQNAEGLLLAGLSKKLGMPLQQSVRLPLGTAVVEVDGASEDRQVLVEVFARVGRLKGAQLHKVSTDALKLVALGREYPKARRVILFASQEAADSVVGWRAAALATEGIETSVVELDEATTAEIVAAQERQRMVNAPPVDE